MMFPIHSWPLHDVASKDLLGHGQFSAFDWLKPAAGQGFWLFQEALFTTLKFHAVTSDILFILILVELFRLLIIYLQEQRVSIGVSVEIAIVSVLREVIVTGVLETDWRQILAVCAFLASMALLMVVRVWLPTTFAGVDPEAHMSARHKPFQEQAQAGQQRHG